MTNRRNIDDRAPARTGTRAARRPKQWAAGLLLSALMAAGCGGGSNPSAPPALSTSGSGAARGVPALIHMPPPVPAPAPGPAPATYSVAVEDVPIDELLFALARDAGMDIDIAPGVEGRVTMNAVDAPLDAVLERISRQSALDFDMRGGVLIVRPDEPVLRTYPIDYVALARDTETMNEVGTGVGGGGDEVGSPVGEENGSAANVKAKLEHRFWEGLVESVRAVVGEASDVAANVFAHRETSVIAVRARPARQREVEALLEPILESARRQVLIEATIVEIKLNDQFQTGVRLDTVLGEFGLDIDIGQLPSNSSYATLALRDLGLTVSLLSKFGEVRVLSTPIVMTLNHQTAIVKVVENRAFFTSEVESATTEGGGAESNVQTTLHTVPVGLVLLVTPAIAANDEVVLKVRPTITQQIGSIQDPNPKLRITFEEEEEKEDRVELIESRIPQIAVREIESVLRLRSGEAAVLGGLMQENVHDNQTGVPFLSELPGIGAAFRYEDRSSEKTELIIFLRPTVIREPGLDGDLKRFRRWWPAAEHGPATLAPSSSASLAAAAAATATTTVGRFDIRRSSAGRDRGHELLIRARDAYARGDERHARGVWLEALRIRPADALAGLAAVALRERRPGEARAWYQRLIALAPENLLARTMAATLNPAREPRARARELERAVAHAPDAAHLQVALGNALAGQGDWKAAHAAWHEARELAPAHPDPAYSLAVGADRSGQIREALMHYREALELAALTPPSFDPETVRARIAELGERARGDRS